LLARDEAAVFDLFGDAQPAPEACTQTDPASMGIADLNHLHHCVGELKVASNKHDSRLDDVINILQQLQEKVENLSKGTAYACKMPDDTSKQQQATSEPLEHTLAQDVCTAQKVVQIESMARQPQADLVLKEGRIQQLLSVNPGENELSDSISSCSGSSRVSCIGYESSHVLMAAPSAVLLQESVIDFLKVACQRQPMGLKFDVLRAQFLSASVAELHQVLKLLIDAGEVCHTIDCNHYASV
jgi:hypothetical protein